MESWSRLSAVRGVEVGGDCLKAGEGTSQRAYMKDPRPGTTVWGLAVNVGGGLGGGVQRGKHIGTTVTAQTIKHYKK